MQEEACDYLKMIPKPISVISIAGLFRTGKSYLLNKILLNSSNKFEVDSSESSENPCTKVFFQFFFNF